MMCPDFGDPNFLLCYHEIDSLCLNEMPQKLLGGLPKIIIIYW